MASNDSAVGKNSENAISPKQWVTDHYYKKADAGLPLVPMPKTSNDLERPLCACR